MLRTTKHIGGIMFDTAKTLGLEFTPSITMSINGKYGVNGVTTGANNLQFYGFGLIERPTVSPTELARIRPQPSDADLYRPIPFKLKPKTQPLSIEDYETYALVAETVIDDVVYNACYFKKFTTTNPTPTEVVSNGDSYTVHAYQTPTNALSPDPVSDIELYPDVNYYLLASSTLGLSITSTEAADMLSAIELLYPDVDPVISQIGLYSGIKGKPAGSLCLHSSVRRTMPITKTEFSIDFGGVLPSHTVKQN